MTTPIFNDPELQRQFDNDGYVVIPFLNPDEIASISGLFYQLYDKVPDGFHQSASVSDEMFKQLINEHTEKIFAPKVESYFHDIKKLGTSFLCKAPGPAGKMDVHQDWTVVDESAYCSVTIWVPLVDTNQDNGALMVLPGSHRFFDVLRNSSLPVAYQGHSGEIWDQMQLVPMKAGQAFILNHALLHASPPNITSKERLAITYGIVRKEAQLMFYYSNKEGRVEKFMMPDDMFMRYHNIGGRPLFGNKVDEFDHTVKPVSGLKLNQLINKADAERKRKPLFKDPQVQRFFEKDGYVKLPVLEAEEVQELLEFYRSLALKDDAGFGFNVSMDQLDKTLVARILEKIYEVALPKAAAHFMDAKPFVASFVIKEANPKSVVPVHQDWTFVNDEDQYNSVTCWVPLQDVNMDNGALGVIRGSHQFFSNFRPSPSPQVPSPIAEHMFTIFPYLQLIELKAGEALIFDNRTFHGSPPNTTGVPRIAFGIGFTQKEAALRHYYLKPGTKDTLLEYAIDETFFRKYENKTLAGMYDRGEMIEGYKLVGEQPYRLPKFSADELLELIKENGNEFNVPMCEKLAKLFDYNVDGSTKEQAADNNPDNTPEMAEVDSMPETVETVQHKWVDRRPFLQKYTPANILREIKNRF